MIEPTRPNGPLFSGLRVLDLPSGASLQVSRPTMRSLVRQGLLQGDLLELLATGSEPTPVQVQELRRLCAIAAVRGFWDPESETWQLLRLTVDQLDDMDTTDAAFLEAFAEPGPSIDRIQDDRAGWAAAMQADAAARKAAGLAGRPWGQPVPVTGLVAHGSHEDGVS